MYLLFNFKLQSLCMQILHKREAFISKYSMDKHFYRLAYQRVKLSACKFAGLGNQ